MQAPTAFVEDRWIWRGALGCLILAGLSGALYRFGISYGVTFGFDLGHVRHAHSHLMFMGWVTPALFVLIARHLSVHTQKPFSPKGKGVIGATLVGALAAFPLFLAFGYGSVAFGSARMPPAAMASGLNMLIWYAFVILYVQARRGATLTRALLFWDLAMAFLMLSSFGAWGLSALKPLGIDDPVWSTALTHLFLDLFSEGWFVLALLGLAYAVLKPSGQTGGHWSLWLVCAGLPMTFALGMPASFVPATLKVMARLGSVLVALGLLVNVAILWRAVAGPHRVWRIPLLLLGIKLVIQLILGAWPGVWWAEYHTLRVFYLHLLLLGFVTLGLVAAATSVWGEAATRGHRWLYVATLLLLASLIPLTPAWPDAWQGTWTLTTAAWIALLPVAAALGMVMRGRGE